MFNLKINLFSSVVKLSLWSFEPISDIIAPSAMAGVVINIRQATMNNNSFLEFIY